MSAGRRDIEDRESFCVEFSQSGFCIFALLQKNVQPTTQAEVGAAYCIANVGVK